MIGDHTQFSRSTHKGLLRQGRTEKSLRRDGTSVPRERYSIRLFPEDGAAHKHRWDQYRQNTAHPPPNGKGLNSVLIDQLYFSGNHPENYHDYKKRIIDADDMRRRREANRRKAPIQTTPKQRNPNEMDVDRSQSIKKTRKCYRCNETGHLAQNCPKKEKWQDF
jgi:hypothetical protein